MGYWERDEDEWERKHPRAYNWIAPVVMIASAVAFCCLLAGCETIGYLHDRNEPVQIRPEDRIIYGPEQTMWRCSTGVFRRCVQIESEWEGKV